MSTGTHRTAVPARLQENGPCALRDAHDERLEDAQEDRQSAERDQATQNAAAAVAAADYGQAVEVAALYARRCLTATRNPSSSPG